MPELPEVETTCRGINPYIVGKHVKTVVVRQSRLRWPISPELKKTLPGQEILNVTRRGKYLLLTATHGTIIIHLGMSGSLKLVEENDAREMISNPKEDYTRKLLSVRTMNQGKDPLPDEKDIILELYMLDAI